jgi:hypothetical protein
MICYNIDGDFLEVIKQHKSFISIINDKIYQKLILSAMDFRSLTLSFKMMLNFRGAFLRVYSSHKIDVRI